MGTLVWVPITQREHMHAQRLFKFNQIRYQTLTESQKLSCNFKKFFLLKNVHFNISKLTLAQLVSKFG